MPAKDLVDLRSDTVTRPTHEMRQAMAEAEVGDDVFGEDPTVNALQEHVATLLNKEAALFVPSGTMGNLLGILSQTRPGETVILSADAHPYNYEAANMAVVGGVLTRTIPGRLGMLTANEIRPCIIQADDPHFSQTVLIAVENTTNRGGGNCYSLDDLTAIRSLAGEFGLRVHCDGARLFNAVVATGHSPADLAAHADTISFCFSKGLGAPAGSIIAGPVDSIRRALKFRKMLGGGMRQAGVLAAAARYALDHHVERLAEDHRRAQAFRAAIEDPPNVVFPMPNPTNILFFDVPDAPKFIAKVGERGVLMLPMGPGRTRAVFHLDIGDSGLNRAIDATHYALSN